MKATRADRRKAELAAIHLGKKALGWDDEIYRTFLHQVTGKFSAADLDDGDRARVLDGMRELGFKRSGLAATPARGESDPQLALIRGLWGDLAEAGALKDASEAGLQAFGKRMTRVSRLEWCTRRQRVVVVEALKAWLARERTPPGNHRPEKGKANK